MQVKSTELILKNMVKHCDEMQKAHKMFSNNKSEFVNNSIYQNAVLFSLLQIGELITHLDVDFKEIHSEIPWNKIKATRNIIVHGYDQLNLDIIWNTSQNEISEFRNFCAQNIQADIIYKEITSEQLKALKQKNINFDYKENQRKIIIKYNKSEELSINSAINLLDRNKKL